MLVNNTKITAGSILAIRCGVIINAWSNHKKIRAPDTYKCERPGSGRGRKGALEDTRPGVVMGNPAGYAGPPMDSYASIVRMSTGSRTGTHVVRRCRRYWESAGSPGRNSER